MAGGPEAFAPIVEGYQDAVFGIAVARLGDFHLAQDVAQQVFVEAFQSLWRLRDPGRLGPWLRKLTLCRCADCLRARRPTAPLEDPMRASPEPGPHERLERQEVRRMVLDAIARLGKAQRETVALFYVNGYSLAEVAAMQEVPVGTVKRRLHDGRQKLKEELVGMVEDVLKSEAPKEDFARRVFELLSAARPRQDWYLAVLPELRRIGHEGIEGYLRAFQSPHPAVRRGAVNLVELCEAARNEEAIAGLLKAALGDPSRTVRTTAAKKCLSASAISDDRKRREFIPLVVGLLFDRAKMVRWQVARYLAQGWAADVPWEQAVRALLDEQNPVVRAAKESLLRAILAAQAPQVPAAREEASSERIAALRKALADPDQSVRKQAVCDLLGEPVGPGRKAKEVVPLVAGMLADRARKVRWRAAYELYKWADLVPLAVVEKALRAENHPRVRGELQKLLKKARAEQKPRQ